MAKKNETTKDANVDATEKVRVTVQDLEALEGNAKKQFDALIASVENVTKAMGNTSEVPLRHLRVVRRDMNASYTSALVGRKGEVAEARKARIAERIAKLEKQLASLGDE